MSDLIERETVLAFVRRCKDRLRGKGLTYDILVDYIESIPSAERKGEWIKDDFGAVICSECKRPRRDNRVNHINFCNSCGAKMKGAEDE